MIPRAAALRSFLDGAGWAGIEAAPLAGDASNRRYLRLGAGRSRAVVMDAPAERGEDVRPFLQVTEILRGAGLSAPEIYAADTDRGFLLIEDLGDDLYARILAKNSAPEPAFYAAAVDLLADCADASARQAEAAALPPYDIAKLLAEARLALDWYVPGVSGEPAPPDLAAEIEARLAEALAPLAEAGSVLVHRDYHAENLLWLPERQGHARVGLLDYQDAVLGHPAYDLVSLLEDARRDTGPELREAMIARYLARRGTEGQPEFRAAYATLGAQRNLKIIGIFARLCLRDAKPRYLGLIPRVWAHLMGDLAHRDLSGLREAVMRALAPPNPDALSRIAAKAPSP